jgi:hypothetical protein
MNLCGEITERFWKEISKSAFNRGISFLITPNEAWKIFLFQNRQCRITNLQLDFTSNGYRGNASLDRIDNDKPYVAHNIQWVLADINLMKGRLNMKYFQYLCSLVMANSQ